jgi:phosphoribosylamine--glycine ligase
VLAVTGQGKTLAEAHANAYAAAEKINWDGVYYRWDIGEDLM